MFFIINAFTVILIIQVSNHTIHINFHLFIIVNTITITINITITIIVQNHMIISFYFSIYFKICHN